MPATTGPSCPAYFCRRDHLCRAAGRRNLLGRLAAELVCPNRQLLRHVPAREDLDRLTLAVDQPAFAEQLRRHHRARIEALGQHVEVHDGVFHAEMIVETPLRNTTMERHLAAFESTLELVPGARLRTLVASSSLGALARSVTTADALLVLLRALGGLEIAQIHDVIPAP